MEKIWIKKELYFEKYEFLKFYLIFPIFIWFCNWFFLVFLILKSRKRVKAYLGADVASGPKRGWRGDRPRRGWRGERAHVARGSTAPLRRGAEATWQDACGPRVTYSGHVGARVGRHVLQSRENYMIVNRGMTSPI